MGTLVLDFDSCLVPVESLELYAERALGSDQTSLAEMEALTRAGMEGEIPFEDSLRKRLHLLELDPIAMQRLGEELVDQTSQGASTLVTQAQDAGHEVWIVSGGFQQIILPVATALGIPTDHVQGVRALFDDRGALLTLDPALPFHVSKVHGLQKLGVAWPRPAIGVGDGATDLALLEAGYVDAFIAYTEHVKRQAVLDRSRHRAENMAQVASLTQELWRAGAQE